MQEIVSSLNELDLALVHALQINPRAPWRLIGEVLDVDPVTVARHWERLSAEGLAWVTAYGASPLMRSMSFALVAVNCHANRVQDVALALLDDPHAVTIAHTVGACDLLVTVWTPDLPTLSHYLLERLSTLPGVAAIHSSVVRDMFADGSHWRLQSLTRDQRQRLHQAGHVQPFPAAIRTASVTLRPQDRDLLVALSRNGRASYEHLASLTGVSASSVRRRLQRLLNAGALALRCEVSRSASGRPVAVTLWLEASPGDLDEAGRVLARFPQTRMCAAIVGGSDLALTVWLRAIEDLQRLEMEIALKVPNVAITGRTLTLRHLKLMGWVLRDDGGAARNVPLDIWRDPRSLARQPRLAVPGNAGA